ncbi:hypothetical protein BaRGS_00032580 [Batillaria attramentaria]|uniref:C2H2-type domain-containing protein n=1 Tax=Batillaria attramentaria TaxID=370345 RepID=A0ABD0JMZ2_9CAEN
MELPISVPVISHDAVEANKALAVMASRIDSTAQRVRDDYEELINLHVDLEDVTTSAAEQSLGVGDSQFLSLGRQSQSQYQQDVQQITLDRNTYERWRYIGSAQGLITDSQIATFLTRHYENTLVAVPSPSRCASCHTAFCLYCPKCSILQQQNPVSQPSLSDIQPSASTIRPSTSTIQPSTSTVQPSTSAVQPSTSTIQPSVPVSSTSDITSVLSWAGPSVPVESAAPEGSKSIILSLPQFVCDGVGSGGLQATGVLNVQNGSLAIMTNLLASPVQSQPLENANTLSEVSDNNSSASDAKTKLSKSAKKLDFKKERSGDDHDCQVSPTTKPKNRKRTHAIEKLFKCTECEASFSNARNLSAHHLKKHAGEVSKSFRCEHCGKTFLNSRDLRTHTYKHTGEMPYKCSFCPSAFTLACNLKTHLRTHTGERPFPCSICPKAFTESGALKFALVDPSTPACWPGLHSQSFPNLTHTGERPYKCENCGAAFSDNSTLWKHKRNHSCDSLVQARKLKIAATSPTVPATPLSAVSLTMPVPSISLAPFATTNSSLTADTPSPPVTVSSLSSLVSDGALAPAVLQAPPVATVTAGGQPVQLSFKADTLPETAFVNTIGWCFPLQQN